MNDKIRLLRLCIICLALSFTGNAIAQQRAEPDDSYKVQPGDVLLISVWGEENLQGEVLVRPDGGISFPLFGDISARDQSVVDLQVKIAARLERYISDPLVTVSIAQVLGNKVYVIGQVNNPGVFVVNPQVDVLQALSMAGGTTAFADLSDIKILRRTGERQQALRFRYNDVIKGRNLEQNILLESGDVVIVP